MENYEEAPVQNPRNFGIENREIEQASEAPGD